MKYKFLIIFSVLFIISISAVSAANADNAIIGEIDDSVDTAISDKLFDGEPAESNSTDVENTNPVDTNSTDVENNNTEPAENEKPVESLPDGTFIEFEKNVLWKVKDGDRVILDRNYNYDGNARKVMSINKQITIDGNGHTLNGKNGARIFYVSKDAKKVTLMNINFINAKIDGAGGAILNDGSQLTIINCKFTNNRITGSTGGAIASNNANNVVIRDCTFSKNYATGVGGAVSITGNNSVLTNNVFTNNEVKTDLGGAVLILGNKATVTGNKFTSNKAGRDGGAIDIEGAKVGTKSQGNVISDNVFTSNSAVFGGALGLNAKDTTVSNNIFKNNKAINSKSYSSAGIGGAMRFIGEKNNKVINNTFEGNTAYRQGGAFYLEGTGSTISDNAFTNNKAEIDAGGTMNVKGNSMKIIKNNITSSSSINAGGAIFINGNNAKITGNVISKAKSTASYGGAIQIRGDAATLTSNKFIQNTAKSNGGAIYIMSDNAVITGNTFEKNSVSKGLAIYGKGDSPKLTSNTFVGGKTAKTQVWDKITPKLTASAKSFKKSVKTKKYTITLKNDWNKVMKNKKVILKVNKKTFTAKTNSKGQATFKITNLKKAGKFTATVKFTGNKYYYTVTKKPKITVK